MNPEFLLRYQKALDILSKPDSSYTLLYEPKAKTCYTKKLGLHKDKKCASAFKQASKSKPEYNNLLGKKATTKKVFHKFLSSVRKLTMTGVLDGAPVRYVSKTKKLELRGIIKGSCYLCGCQSCNYTKTLNAYEFEKHAGCQTSHPNNHIHFENGKSMHMVVKELNSIPESSIFDAIQTQTSFPIDQKALSAWKDSFQAA